MAYDGIPDWFEVDPLSDRTPLEQYFAEGARQRARQDEILALRRAAAAQTRATQSLDEELHGLAAELGIEVRPGMHAADVVRAARARVAKAQVVGRVRRDLSEQVTVPGKSDLVSGLATDVLVQRLRADAEQFSREFADIDADAFVQRVLDRLGLVPPAGPPVVTFVADTVHDGVAIEVDGKQVWWESSFDRLGQWLQGSVVVGRAVVLDYRVDAPDGETAR